MTLPQPRDRIWAPSVEGGRFNSEVHVTLAQGHGVWAQTTDGRQFLDANAGLWHLSLGYAPEPVVDAASAALRGLGGTSLLRRLHRGAEDLAELLARQFGEMEPVIFFATSGSEAVDAALRIGLAHGSDDGRTEIGYLANAYHGVSIGPLALNDSPRYRGGVPAALPSVKLPSPTEWALDPEACAEWLEAVFATHGRRLAAVIAEPIQCVGGIVEVPSEYLATLASAAARHGFLLIADEVSTGVFRTGSFLASESAGVDADIIVLAKGLTGGVSPMSVVAVRPEVAGRLRSATSMRRLPGSTQAGDPVGCASVQAVLEYCRDAQNSAARERSAGILRTGIEQLADEPVVESIFGIGHLWGIRIRDEFVVSAPSFIRKFTALGLNHGLLLHPLSAGVVPVMPALTISDGEIADLATRLRSVLRAAADGASGGS